MFRNFNHCHWSTPPEDLHYNGDEKNPWLEHSEVCNDILLIITFLKGETNVSVL